MGGRLRGWWRRIEQQAPERGQAAAGRAELGRPAAWVLGVGWRATAAVGNEDEKEKSMGEKKKKGKKEKKRVPLFLAVGPLERKLRVGKYLWKMRESGNYSQ